MRLLLLVALFVASVFAGSSKNSDSSSCDGCTDITEQCVCPTQAPVIQTTAQDKSKSKSKDKSKSKSSSSDATGYGDCDCDKDYGMVEMRLRYSGSATVDISYVNKDGGEMCRDEDIITGAESICDLRSVSGYDKYSTDTTVYVYTAGTNSQISSAKIHTSCSSDIVGECYGDLVVSGWADGNPNDDNDCDDGLEDCDCEGVTDEPTVFTTPAPTEDVCYCDNTDVTTADPTTSTTSYSDKSKDKSKSKDKTSSKDKSKSKSSSNDYAGYGDCDCDKDYGMVLMRLRYSGADTVDISYVNKDGGEMCRDEDITANIESECDLRSVSGYEKYSTDTTVYVYAAGTNTKISSASIHTSCSSDIVGETYGDLTVSGWADGNPNDDNDCDDGIVECPCPTVEPTTAAPVTASPTTSDPTTASPTTSDPTTASPTTSEPTTASPTTSSPTTADPTTSSPTTSSPTTSDPTTAAPTTSEPTTASPTTADPTTASPTSASPTSASPTSASPTTSEPTSASPTTSEPTTASPTTSDPTTAAPTTSEPTTADPTTASPTSASPTTSEPTTADPTTAAPTTSEPTTASPTTAEPTTPDTTTTTVACAELTFELWTESYFGLCEETEGCIWDTADSYCDSSDGQNQQSCCIAGTEDDDNNIGNPDTTTADPTTSTSSSTSTPVTTQGTTDVPSSAPTFVACDTDDAFNIAFLLDESGSVSTDEWDVIKTFVDRIASFDVAGPSYVSLFEYGSLPAYTQFLGWTSVETGSAAISRALGRNPYNTAGLTYTWDATNRVLDEFFDYRQTCTDGCDTRADLLFLLTDGAPTIDADGHTVCDDMIARVNASRVDIVIVGIGNDAATWMDEIDCLDFKDNGADIFFVTEFDSDGFNAIEGLIREKTCNGQNPAGESDREEEAWVYEDGTVGMGPVPTGDPDGTARPMDDTPSPLGISSDAFTNGESGSSGALEGETGAMGTTAVWGIVGAAAVLLLAGGAFVGYKMKASPQGASKIVDMMDVAIAEGGGTELQAVQPFYE